MIFRRSNKTVKKTAKGMDKLITGIIIGGAAASIFGISRSQKGKKFWQRYSESFQKNAKIGLQGFGECIVGVIKFFQNKK